MTTTVLLFHRLLRQELVPTALLRGRLMELAHSRSKLVFRVIVRATGLSER
jgi:hypothetical protein